LPSMPPPPNSIVHGYYVLHAEDRVLDSAGLIQLYERLVERFPHASLSRTGWQRMTGRAGLALTQSLGSKIQLVGDDLFVTSITRLERGIQQGCGNSILIKPEPDWHPHRDAGHDSLCAPQRLFNYYLAPLRRDRRHHDCRFGGGGECRVRLKRARPAEVSAIAKYNQLLRIEEELGILSGLCGWLGVRIMRRTKIIATLGPAVNSLEKPFASWSRQA
jgi:enolase